MDVWTRFINWLFPDNKPEGGRSGRWPKVRMDHLERFPTCAACDGTEEVEVHHIAPFHVFPRLELHPDNLITLCEKKGCHLLFGHLGNYRSWNQDVEEDVKRFLMRVRARPC